MSASDSELLQRYVAEKSEPSFRELIERRIGLVYSVALRNAGFDATVAEEVAQQVFILLAQKARNLTGHPSLTAWLFTATRQIALRHQQSEVRRRIRDQKAHEMSHVLAPDSPTPDWSSLRLVIDQAIAELEETDQRAVLWRFFEKEPFAGIGVRLGISEEAARKRVARALDTLHGALSRRGVTSTAAAIGLALEGHAVAAAPGGLAGRILGAVAVTGAFVLPTVAPALLASRPATLFTGTKLTLGLAGLVVAVTLGYRVWHSSAPTSVGAVSSVTNSGGEVHPVRERVDPMTRLRAVAQAHAEKSAADLDAARRRLREVLTVPARTTSYPPKSLEEALALFQGQMGEAVPILLEALRVEDSETQTWALSGLRLALQIWTGEDLDGTRSRAMAEIRPLVGRMLAEPHRSGMIRMLALGILRPSMLHGPGSPDNQGRPDLDSLAEVERALHATLRKSDSFRFTIADTLIGMGDLDPDTEQVIRRLVPMLDDPVEEDRILAAYAIARSPIEKPAAVKAVLLTTLATPYHICRSRAARGLGALGINAVEAVPTLLEYARTVPFPNGEREAALTAACRIQPELRASYPEIDRSLQLEEQARTNVTRSVAVTFRAGILRLAAEGDESLRRFLLNCSGLNEEETQRNRAMLLAALEREMQSGTAEEKALLQKASDLLRSTSGTNPEEASVTPAPTEMGNLTLAARVILTDEHNANESKIEEALEQFQGKQLVTRESAEALSKILEDIDPTFRRQWREQVLQYQPWLDRLMPK